MSLIATKFTDFWPSAPPRFRSEMTKRLTCVRIDEAARWLYEESPQERWSWEEDFPVALSPWPFGWFEWSLPHFVRSGQQRTAVVGWGNDAPPRMGALVITIPVDLEETQGQTPRDLSMAVIDMVCREFGHKPEIIGPRIGSSTGAQTRFLEFIQLWIVPDGGRGRPRLCEVATIPIDPEGRAIGEGVCRLVVGIAGMEDEDLSNVSGLDLPLGFAISLCHCKRGVSIDADQTQYPVRVKGGNPVASFRFRTLHITQLRKEMAGEGSGRQGICRALHLCRGHFADYRKGSGLFGKYHGLFWVPLHLRGSQSRGVVEKDYDVGVPEYAGVSLAGSPSC